MNIPFKLGIITDEVTQNVFEAAQFCKKHGLQCMEVRSVNGHSPFEYTDSDIDDISSAARQYNLEVTAISSPLFKCNFDDLSAEAENLKGFERCAAYAKRLGTQYIRGFDFWDEGVSVEARSKKYAQVISICEKYDVYCALESDPAVHSSTPHKLAELISAVNHPRIKALFDPGNEIWVTGKASADAYDALKPCGIVNIHIKDGVNNGGKTEAVKVGTGSADFVNLFKKLIADGYKGGVMLETHYRKNAGLTEEQLKLPGGAAFSDGAYEASEESIISLKEIINHALEELNR